MPVLYIAIAGWRQVASSQFWFFFLKSASWILLYYIIVYMYIEIFKRSFKKADVKGLIWAGEGGEYK